MVRWSRRLRESRHLPSSLTSLWVNRTRLAAPPSVLWMRFMAAKDRAGKGAGRHALLPGSYLALSELCGIEYAHRRSRFKLDFGPTKQALASDYRFGKRRDRRFEAQHHRASG